MTSGERKAGRAFKKSLSHHEKRGEDHFKERKGESSDPVVTRKSHRHISCEENVCREETGRYADRPRGRDILRKDT